ncbi:MAG: ATP-binding cassette domain-containing protein [Clostridia bacterium]|nr:ATP-binding cassette domain-containing protein [Clostridia bacterium]MCI2014197.1 ATP-binding cassette domain-containing protein [Clostridia bacterium]
MIELKNVSKTYVNNSIGVENASFYVNDGEFVFIVGKSGSGKSTLLKLLTKELSPTSGDIFVYNLSLNKIGRKELPYYRRLLGIIDKNISLMEQKTVYENLELAMLAAQQPSKKIKDSIPRALGLVGMNKKINEYPSNMSEGERLRILIARAVVNNPKIIIADEPTASLDYETAWDIMCLFNDINRLGITVIIATHAKKFVDIMKKRVITLNNGKVLGDVKKGKYGWIV